MAIYLEGLCQRPMGQRAFTGFHGFFNVEVPPFQNSAKEWYNTSTRFCNSNLLFVMVIHYLVEIVMHQTIRPLRSSRIVILKL